MTRSFAFAFALACLAGLRATASAEWRPPDLRPTKTPLADVLAAYAKATGPDDPRFLERRERWTYVNGAVRLAVNVAVKGDDFRATMMLGNSTYAAGRSAGVRWRADGNGVTHATLSDDQGDALDRLPQSVFAFTLADCTLAGESDRFAPAWVLVDRAPRDKPHWLYVDKASGTVAHEITREGARTMLTSFDRFEPLGTMRRPRHWRASDGDAAHDLDVTVDDVVRAPIDAAAVAASQQPRVFAPLAPPANGSVSLPAHFRGKTIFVDVDVAGRRTSFILDTGTASITVDRRFAKRAGAETVLEHATVERMTVGPLALSDASVLSIPIFGNLIDGILGYDFFLGHVLHVDYANQRVEVLTPQAAEPAFHAPKTTVIDAYFDEGVPLVHAAFGAAAGDRFALDTGSQHLFVLAPFARRHAKTIAEAWPPTVFSNGRPLSRQVYLEGSILVTARQVAAFTLGPARFTALTVGVEDENDNRDAIDIALDGIIGTDEMSQFEWWFDYDNGRIAMRRN